MPTTPAIEAGQLNRRVSIQQQTTAQDATGQEQQTWTTIYTCWARINVMTGQLLYETSEFISQAAVQITIRYTSSYVVNVGDQILYTEATTGVLHTYQVKVIVNREQRNRQLSFICYEINAQE